MPTKLKIKIGHIEFEYEGEAPYDTDAVKDLFTHLETLMSSAPPGTFDAPLPPSSSNNVDPKSPVSDDLGNLAPNTVAARLNAKSGPDVAIVAAAHLQICKGKDTFDRDELRKSMQGATSYYKESMNGNLTQILDGLITSQRINSLANNRMSLSATEMASLKARLAQP